MDKDIENRIRERAYEIWEEEGRPEGREAQHWQQAAAETADAQRENREAIARSSAKPAGTTRKKAAGSKSASSKGTAKSAAADDKSGKTGTGIRKPREKKSPAS